MPDLSWRDAIIEVLRTEPESLHYIVITEKIIERELRTQIGATPAASVGATLSESIKYDADNSPFERVSKGHYRLRGGPFLDRLDRDLAGESTEELEAGLINAFGMYWNRDFVSWKTPRLLGQQQPGRPQVDFALQRGVYLLHDRREVIYVGRTNDQSLGERLKQHTLNRLNGRWDRFSWFGIHPVHANGTLGTDAELTLNVDNLIATMEALLIEGLEPRQNRKRGDGFSAVEFLQIVDPELNRKSKLELLDQLKGIL